MFWRACLYVAVSMAWHKMRVRALKQIDKNTPEHLEAHKRFLRIETASICVITALEISQWLS